MPIQNDLLSMVEALENAANRHAIDDLMTMFADDAEVELVGMGRLIGKKQIRSMFEYDEGVNGELLFIDCIAETDTVSCQLVEKNDRFRMAGLDKVLYPSCVLSFKNKLIRSFRVVPDPETIRIMEQFWGAARLWIAEHYPSDHARMFTPNGQFIRNRNNGERAVQLAREYREHRV